MGRHEPQLARTVWRRLEAIHAVTYFAPEAVTALADAGYRGFWMGYFAGRAAPLGAVGAEVVTAIFYNFAPARVAKALPDAWGFAPPEAALSARLSGSVAAMQRSLGEAADGADVTTAAELAGRAARSAPIEGRALSAGNSGLPWPTDPLGELWQAATLLREHRGDGHVTALTTLGLSGRESNVFQAAAGNTTRIVLARARDYDESEWQEIVDELAARDLVTADGALTDAGQALKVELEDVTDRVALTAYDVLDDTELDRLVATLTPIARAVVAAGDLPPQTPIGLTFNE